MQFWVGITDDDWFVHLSRLKPDEVNHWQHSPKPLRHLDPGMPYLFKLHAPNDVIVGGGWFAHFSTLPCFLAWQAFGHKNGVPSLADLIKQTSGDRPNRGSELGCNLILQPFFLPEDDWIPIPENWSPNIHGLTYDTEEQYGAELWQAVQRKMAVNNISQPDTINPGPGTFQVQVTDAYHRRCAVTNENTLPALAVTSIKPEHKQGPRQTGNGLLLRNDLQQLFRDGYVSLDEDLRFLVSEQLREQYADSSEYTRYHGARLQNLPDIPADQPNQDYIRWHREECFERI